MNRLLAIIMNQQRVNISIQHFKMMIQIDAQILKFKRNWKSSLEQQGTGKNSNKCKRNIPTYCFKR